MTGAGGAGALVLASDFGAGSAYVGQMRGAALRAAPGVTVHDLWHGVPPQQVALAARLLPRMWCAFPYRAVQVAVVDPGVGTERRALVVEWNGRLLVGPDNGLFTVPLDQGAEVRIIDPERHGEAPLSRTFHGRDLFAPVGARIAAGQLTWSDFDPLTGPPAHRLDLVQPESLAPGMWQGEVIWADDFGNLVTNLPADLVGEEPWELRFADTRVGGRGTYGEVDTGEPLALVGSFDLVELALRDASAARRYGLGPGDGVLLCRR